MRTGKKIRYHCTRVNKKQILKEIDREIESFPMIKVGNWLKHISTDLIIILSDIVGPIVRAYQRSGSLKSVRHGDV
jgi:hypothetical protein